MVFMKKHLRRLAAFALAAGMTVCGFTAVASAREAENPDGYVTVCVEKFTIGQGYISVPQKVSFYEGENGIDLVKRAVGEENVQATSSDWGSYLSGFADDGGKVLLPEILSGHLDADSLSARAREGFLSEFDYTTEAGYIFLLNDKSASTGIDSYTPKDGDVIRICFSVYGYGSDIGVDNSSWGGSPSLIGDVSRQNATLAVADAVEAGLDISDEISVISDLDSTQAQIDEAVLKIGEKLTPETDSSAIPDGSDSTADTGAYICLVLPITALAAVFLTCKHK